MSVFYETLRSQALEMATDETPLAEEPTFSVSRELREAGLNFKLDMDAVMEGATQHGKSPADLGALAVYLFTDSRYGVGGFHTTPLAIDGQIHYPAFGVCVDKPQSPDLAALNCRFRHEFRHIMQEKLTRPLYSRRWARHTVRAVAIPLALIGWKQNIDIISGDADYGFLPALESIGSSALLAALSPYRAMWALTPREIDANYFAWRNKEFAPISLATTED